MAPTTILRAPAKETTSMVMRDREHEHPRIILLGRDHNIPDRFSF